MDDRVTLLIPTKDRADFLLRLLGYYRRARFRGWLAIGDSSAGEHLAAGRRAVDSFREDLSLIYAEYPGMHNAACVLAMLDAVPTPYVALLPDDDFLVPDGLARCVRFLENHPDYGAAHGLAILFEVEPSGPFGRIVTTSRYWQRAVEGETVTQRLVDHLPNYFCTLFSVHRREHMRGMYRDTPRVPEASFALELLPATLSVVYGKVKELECLYLARQAHSRRYHLPDLYDQLTDRRWQPSFEMFRDRLVEEITRADGLSPAEAALVVKQALWGYLRLGMTMEGARPKGLQAVRAHVRRRLPPGLRRVVRELVTPVLARQEYRFSLPALLRSSSPYHAAFMPIYNAVADGRGEPASGADGERR